MAASNERGLGGGRGFHVAQEAFERLVSPPPAVSRQRPANGGKRPALFPFAQGFFGLRPSVQEVPVRPVDSESSGMVLRQAPDRPVPAVDRAPEPGDLGFQLADARHRLAGEG